MYEVTFIEANQTYEWTRAECELHFGKDEFLEYLMGYLPHVIVIKLD